MTGNRQKSEGINNIVMEDLNLRTEVLLELIS